jgi:hypothetical protein
MATSKTGLRLGTATAKSAKATSSGEAEKPLAMTVKVDGTTYVRICMLGATQRRTDQDILHEAVRLYLDRVKA